MFGGALAGMESECTAAGLALVESSLSEGRRKSVSRAQGRCGAELIVILYGVAVVAQGRGGAPVYPARLRHGTAQQRGLRRSTAGEVLEVLEVLRANAQTRHDRLRCEFTLQRGCGCIATSWPGRSRNGGR